MRGGSGLRLAALAVLALCGAHEARRLLRGEVDVSSRDSTLSTPLEQERAQWKVWTSGGFKGQPAEPIQHTRSSTSCRWAPLLPPPTPGLPRPSNASICLRSSDDLLCNAILREGYWSECADLPALHAWSTAKHAGGGMFVDVGANIGACSLHMLLSSDAAVVAFEPGANNLFFASSSFLRLSKSLPQVRNRLHLYPLGTGDTNSSASLFSAVGNAGHSVIGQQPKLYAPQGHEKAQPIILRTLDDVLWPRSQRGRRPHPIALLKLDVEGYECRALKGMLEILRAGAVHVIKIEVFDYGLRAQGCSGVQLQQMLISYGFLLVVASADGKMPSSRDLAQRPLHPADKLYSTAPYNLYCFQADMLDTPKAPQAYSHQDGLRRDRSASHRQRSLRNRRRLSRDNTIEV